MKTHVDRMLDSMCYMGPNRVKQAWLMFLATYSYTRSWDGCEGPDGTPMDFGRWYSFCCAVRCAWWYLWPRPTARGWSQSHD